MIENKKIGLVAGRGYLPFEVLSEIRSRGQSPVVVGLKGESDPNLSEQADDYQELPTSWLGSIIANFKAKGVTELVFAGKVTKEGLFKEEFDETLRRLLLALPQKNDDAILLAIVKEFEENGLVVAKQTEYLRRLLAPAGSMIGTVTDSELMDIKLGFKMAKAMGDLDIGQSVVVKKGVVLAVEAIEGTDQAIIRGGSLGGPGAVVVKVSKPQQDERFDVPTIGMLTIKSMIQAQANVLGIEAEKTLITEKKEVLSLAAENHIKIFAGSFN